MALTVIEKINQAIADAGADWVAGETPFTKYFNRTSKLKSLGMSMSPEQAFSALASDRKKEQEGPKIAAASLPPQIDWRNHRGHNWVTPIRDQKTCGSCVAFATVASIEARMRIQQSNAAYAVDLSEAHLFNCGAPNSCDAGWQPTLAMAYARTHGIGTEADFPYKPRDMMCKQIPSVVKVKKTGAASTSLARKKALTEGPVVASMAVFSDLTSYKSGVYRHVIGKLTGYHAVCVVGYDDSDGCWIVKNSWGKDWGDNGFFKIRYGECGIDTQYSFLFPDGLVF